MKVIFSFYYISKKETIYASMTIDNVENKADAVARFRINMKTLHINKYRIEDIKVCKKN